MEINEETINKDRSLSSKKITVTLGKNNLSYTIKDVKSHQLDESKNRTDSKSGKATKLAILNKSIVDLTFSYKVRVIPLTRAGQPPNNLLQSSSSSFALTTIDTNLFDIKSNSVSKNVVLNKLDVRQIKIGEPIICVSWDVINDTFVNKKKDKLKNIVKYVIVKFTPILGEDDHFQQEVQNLESFKVLRTLFDNKLIEIRNFLDLVSKNF